ncbi:unnamed protein product [Vitrella brassicaformis CCMP3155]|uniref:Uncharacterized protein n=1 Tax=Vitrella brassicaformis (strain CCMP3155) TaxID=1169540 RepID=A0A0G4GJM4_VITBC|nr:unnamed protein product [Vitrella brassicaformis CCMP3155]|eukprot:CEM30117.1 unnamed protein product [Vitrella brassicaformis CCMP3155]
MLSAVEGDCQAKQNGRPEEQWLRVPPSQGPSVLRLARSDPRVWQQALVKREPKPLIDKLAASDVVHQTSERATCD